MKENHKNVHISHIDQGKIERACISDPQKHKTTVRATLSKPALKQAEQEVCEDQTFTSTNASEMKVELLRKLQDQRIRIQEEQERCEHAKDAWIKHLEEIKQVRHKANQKEG